MTKPLQHIDIVSCLNWASRAVMAAAALWGGLLLTACSDTVLDDVAGGSAPEAEQDVPFLADAAGARHAQSTRATDAMTLSQLQATGFGVYASFNPFGFYIEKWNMEHNYVSTPNFMFNQKVTYDAPGDAAWHYEPLKYWPNEAADNSAWSGPRTHTLSFFAYAPYQASDESSPLFTLPGTPPAALWNTTNADAYDHNAYLRTEWFASVYSSGDDAVRNFNCDPVITYSLKTDRKASTDLVVGVVARENTIQQYVGTHKEKDYWRNNKGELVDDEGKVTDDVNKAVYDVVEVADYTYPSPGTSYMNVVKPPLNTKLIFDFFHALAALRVNVRADWTDDADTRITISRLTIGGTVVVKDKVTGEESNVMRGFFPTGQLNLRTVTPYVANWVDAKDGSGREGTVAVPATEELLSYIHSSLKDAGGGNVQPVGVTQTNKNLFTGEAASATPTAEELIYLIPIRAITTDAGTGNDVAVGYEGGDNDIVPIEIEYYATTTDGTNADNSARWKATSKRYVKLKLQSNHITTLNLVVTMQGVEVTTNVDEWTDGSSSSVDLPKNH